MNSHFNADPKNSQPKNTRIMTNRLSHHPLLLLLLLAVAPAFSQAPATKEYPTAGGAGGKVITVTSLEDSGPGTLREALNTTGPRIIRFGVGGEIWLKDKLVFNSPFVTVEGESAPAPGITLMGDKLRIRAHDVILRNIRVRVGALLTNSDPQNRDGIAIEGSQDGSDPNYNVLVENCSVSWAIDENVQIWGRGSHDIVVRNCILAEGLAKGHPKGGTHSAGLIVGPDTRKVTVQGNLFAHNAFRNPVAGGGSESVIVNNLIYNPGFGGFMVYGGGDQSKEPTKTSVVGNVLVSGPNTVKRPIATYHQKGINPGSQIFYKDNVAAGVTAYDPAEKTKPNSGGEEFTPAVSEPPVPLGDIALLPSSEVEAHVLAHAGALPDARDAIDTRIIEEVKSRTGKIADLPSDERLSPQAIAFVGPMNDFAKLLAKYASPKGVRYAAWKQDAGDMAALQRVVDAIASSQETDLAFLINAHNAWILHEVLGAYPVKVIDPSNPAFFDAERITVGGRKFSFNGLEREIASRFHDPRAVFALSLAARGGPDLNPVPLSSGTLNVQLDQLAGAFINSEKGVGVGDGKVRLSKIFDWQKAQFPAGARTIIDTYRHTHAPDAPFVYQEYDTTLNEAP